MTKAERKIRMEAHNRLLLLAVEEFRKVVPSEQDSIPYIINKYKEEGLTLQCTCGHSLLTQDIGNSRMTKCNRCKRDCWITAGTMFEHARQLFPYLLVMHFRKEKIAFNPKQLATVTGVAVSTAREISAKISMVLVEETEGDFQEISTLCFMDLYQRRSGATPSYSHPRAEQIEFENQESTASVVDEIKSVGAKLSPHDELVYEAIPAETTITLDRLLDSTRLSLPDLSLSLLFLQIDLNLIDREFGDLYRRRAQTVKHPSQNSSKHLALIEKFITYVIDHHQGVSRKYIQLYAVNFWCLLHPERWKGNALLTACLRSKPITRREISNYVSPAHIKVLPTTLAA